MIAPTLLVGLGGKGSEVILRVSNKVGEEQRKHLGFVVFDTDINELREIQRANPFIRVIQTSTNLTVGEYLSIDTHARDTWFPVNAILNSKALTEGAGQVRAVSRLAFDTAVRAGKMEQLHEAIQDLYKLEEGSAEQALRVIIVSSLAGGTGSGLVLPVALYIKNYLAARFRQSANITRGFFLLPEVFDEVVTGQAERNNLRSNAYATLRELDAFLMKGDATLSEQYKKSVKIEFPHVGSDGYDEYNVRPYDFCFLFDAQNAEGKKLNSFKQYLEHAANCIYAQSLGPMNKRSNSSEDNTIRLLCAERGRNRYAGAGSSMLVYPMEDVKEYVALRWAKECISKQWMMFDELYKLQHVRDMEMREKGYRVQDADPIKSYMTTVETKSKDKDPFAKSIVDACTIFGEDGLSRINDKWVEYVDILCEKIRTDESSGQKELDDQHEQILDDFAELEGGTDSWENFQKAYEALNTYKAMIIKHSEDTARTIAYTMFKSPCNPTVSEKLPHRLETYLHDGEGNFIHPNAVRYFLYQTLGKLKRRKNEVETKNNAALQMFDSFSKQYFDWEDTDVVETAADLTDKKVPIVNRIGKLSEEQEKIKKAYKSYLNTADVYRGDSVLALVLEEGISYVKGLCDAFQKFFQSFEGQVATIEKKIAGIQKKYEYTKGTATRYVCASAKCFQAMASQLSYKGSSITIDSQLAEDIYMQVRGYSLMSSKPGNDSYFREIFEEGILGYFKKSLMSVYSSVVDMDIISALEAEAKYEQEEYDDSRVEQYVRKAIQSTRALSCPFIEKPLGEEKQPIFACTYNRSINPHDDSRRARIIDQELQDAGGIEDENIAKNMILFYQSIYGLRANDLSKFAPPEKSLTSTRDGGEYYKAYFELIDQLHPESHRSQAITPHIDRWWHVVTKMPDLDEKNQAMQEQRIYAAFFWGLLLKYVELRNTGSDRRSYYLDGTKLDMDMADGADMLIVSNGTPCDRLYEVLDALAIYPELVNKILDSVEMETAREVDKAVPVDDRILKYYLDRFELEEYPLHGENSVRSVFDIPILMKKSIKADMYHEGSVLRILQAEISEIKNYLLNFCAPEELPAEMGNILQRQYEMFLNDMKEEQGVGKNIYQDRLFGNVCSIIAKEFEKLGFTEESRAVSEKAKEKGRAANKARNV